MSQSSRETVTGGGARKYLTLLAHTDWKELFKDAKYKDNPSVFFPYQPIDKVPLWANPAVLAQLQNVKLEKKMILLFCKKLNRFDLVRAAEYEKRFAAPIPGTADRIRDYSLIPASPRSELETENAELVQAMDVFRQEIDEVKQELDKDLFSVPPSSAEMNADEGASAQEDGAPKKNNTLQDYLDKKKRKRKKDRPASPELDHITGEAMKDRIRAHLGLQPKLDEKSRYQHLSDHLEERHDADMRKWGKSDVRIATWLEGVVPRVLAAPPKKKKRRSSEPGLEYDLIESQADKDAHDKKMNDQALAELRKQNRMSIFGDYIEKAFRDETQTADIAKKVYDYRELPAVTAGSIVDPRPQGGILQSNRPKDAITAYDRPDNVNDPDVPKSQKMMDFFNRVAFKINMQQGKYFKKTDGALQHAFFKPLSEEWQKLHGEMNERRSKNFMGTTPFSEKYCVYLETLLDNPQWREKGNVVREIWQTLKPRLNKVENKMMTEWDQDHHLLGKKAIAENLLRDAGYLEFRVGDKVVVKSMAKESQDEGVRKLVHYAHDNKQSCTFVVSEIQEGITKVDVFTLKGQVVDELICPGAFLAHTSSERELCGKASGAHARGVEVVLPYTVDRPVGWLKVDKRSSKEEHKVYRQMKTHKLVDFVEVRDSLFNEAYSSRNENLQLLRQAASDGHLIDRVA